MSEFITQCLLTQLTEEQSVALSIIWWQKRLEAATRTSSRSRDDLANHACLHPEDAWFLWSLIFDVANMLVANEPLMSPDRVRIPNDGCFCLGFAAPHGRAACPISRLRSHDASATRSLFCSFKCNPVPRVSMVQFCVEHLAITEEKQARSALRGGAI